MKNKQKIRIPTKMPQKLEEELCDAMENLALNSEMVAMTSYQQGYVDGYKKGLQANKQ
jgi:hypothetical protein